MIPYGTSKEYATEISKQKNIPAYSFQELPDSIIKFDEIIHLGAIYMGKILGFDKFIKKYRSIYKKLTVISVGMYNPKRESNYMKIEALVKRNVKKTNFNLGKIYCLSGHIDVKRLSFTHKLLVNALYKKAKKQAISKLNEDEMDIIKSYENDTPFDLRKLDNILEEL